MNINKLLKYVLIGLLLGGATVLYLTVLEIEVTGYVVALMLYSGVVAAVEIGSRKSYKSRKKEYEEIDSFLSEVRHSFYAHGMADEAVNDAMELQGSAYMRAEAIDILEVLNSEDTGSAAEEYRFKKKNRYLKLFLTLCLTVIEYGDKKSDAGSLFLGNIMNLKEELRAELEAEALLRARMAGTGFIAAAPAFGLKLIEKWGISNLPELEDFYKSSLGVTLMTTLFTISAAIYAILCILRGKSEPAEPVFEILQRLSLKPAIQRFLYRISRVFRKGTEKINTLINESGSVLKASEVILAKILLAGGTLLTLTGSVLICSFSGRNSISMLFAFVLAILVFFVPDILLLVKRYLNQIRMEEEVAQYNSVITMLMYVERISVYELLEELEQFAVSFRKNISDCLNDFHSGEEKALENLRDSSGCIAFRNLADKLIMCDKIGVRAAFDEVKADRDFYMKRRERETAQSIQRRAVLGQFVAFIPLVLSVGIYLIVPFAKESIRMLAEITAEINL